MRSHAMGICLLALAYIGVSGSALAQDAVPETPPELRDFRLDEPRPVPQPQPQPQPDPPAAQTPPPAVRTVPEPTREQPAPAPRNSQPSAVREVAPVSDPALDNDTETLENPATEDPGTSLPPAEPAAPQVEATQAQPEPVKDTASTFPILWAVGGGALFGLLAFLFWRRRRRLEEAFRGIEIALPDAPKNPAPAPKRDMPPVAPRPEPQPPAPDIRNVSITFIPEKATVSFTNLTVHGQLQIINESTQIAKDMQLRAVLLSASSQQQLAIDSFFTNPAQIEPNTLGEAQPGERLGLSLELSVPLSDMQSFPLGDQRLLVPIIIATLTYADESGATTDAKLACMIGREANPPQPKMGPLRLDKGPRSFAPLGQRPVYA